LRWLVRCAYYIAVPTAVTAQDAGLAGAVDQVPVRERVEITVAVPGVYEYVDPETGEKFSCLVPAEELFSPATVETLIGAPLIVNHPSDNDGMVTEENFRNLAQGATSSPYVLHDRALCCKAAFWNPEAHEIVRAGIREVSGGKTCDYEMTSGEFEGKPYDRIQRNIRFNHVAIVPAGNVGPVARIHLDSKGNPMPPENGKKLFWRCSDGSEIEVVPEVFAEFMFLKSKAAKPGKKTARDEGEDPEKPDETAGDQEPESGAMPAGSPEEKEKALLAQIQTLLAEIETLKAERAAAMEEAAKAPERAEALAAEKAELMDQAKAVLGDMDVSRLPAREIKTQVLAKLGCLPKTAAGVSLDSVSDTDINARYSVAIELRKQKNLAHDSSATAQKPDGFGLDPNWAYKQSFERGVK
jgi:hypothetical protein